MYFTVLFLMSQQHFDIIWEIQLYEAHGTFSKMEDYYLWKLDILRMRKKYVSLNIHRGARDPLHTTLLGLIEANIPYKQCMYVYDVHTCPFIMYLYA